MSMLVEGTEIKSRQLTFLCQGTAGFEEFFQGEETPSSSANRRCTLRDSVPAGARKRGKIGERGADDATILR
jgi:hypothetical protein